MQHFDDNRHPHSAHPHPPSSERPVVAARPVQQAQGDTPPRRRWGAWCELIQISRRGAWLDLALVFVVAVVLQYGPSLVLGGSLTGLTEQSPNAASEPAATQPTDLEENAEPTATAPGESAPAPPNAAPTLPDLPNLGVQLVLGKWGEAFLALTLLGYLMLRHHVRSEQLGITHRALGTQLAKAGLTLVAIYAALLATVIPLIIYLTFQGPEAVEELTRQRQEGMFNVLPIDSLATTIALMAAVAIHEEIIFRALLIPYLMRILRSPLGAVLVSSLIFGLLHIPGQGILGGVQTTLLGIVFGTAFLLTRSLLAMIIAHFAFNVLQVQLIRFLMQSQDWLQSAQNL